MSHTAPDSYARRVPGLIALLACCAAGPSLARAADSVPPASATARNITFFLTSDPHYKCFDKEAGNARRTETVAHMNAFPGSEWPAGLGGGKVDAPRAVLVLGDCIDTGDLERNGQSTGKLQYAFFTRDFGLDGTDGLLKFPVFEGWGNHDGPPIGKEKNGFSFQAQLKERNRIRLEKKLIGHLAENGLHYSWDWDDVHLVQLNLYPADKQRAGVHYSAEWHDPQGALTFLKQDLAANVGTSGRPVVLMSHCGFDTDWWSKDDWREAYEAVRQYNVVVYLYGHTGTGLHDWAPDGETRKWFCVNDGNTSAGFFIVNITATELRVGEQLRRKPDAQPDGWEWANMRKIPLPQPPAALAAAQ